jgi:arylsulfatase A-like enzyme
LRWLDSAWSRDGDRPALLYLQYIDPHAPYDPAEPFRSRFARGDRDASVANEKLLANRWFLLDRDEVDLLQSLYDAEVASVDAQLRLLFDELQKRGFLDDAIVVVTADHGEEFWEHGNLSHGIALYEESVRVPLIIAAPGQQGGRRVDEAVSLLDVAPTLLSLLGLPADVHFEGRSLAEKYWPRRTFASLWRRLTTAATGEEGVLLELEPTSDTMDAREHRAALRRGAQKLLLRTNGFSELYDLGADPGETAPAPPGQDQRQSELEQRLAAERSTLQRRAGAVPERAPLDEATREKLRALGYQF